MNSLACVAVSAVCALAADARADEEAAKAEREDKPWYEQYALRGYAQVRYNRLYASNADLENQLADTGNVDGSTFTLRRARLVVSGDVTSLLAIYLQSEFAGADVKMRDWYGDIFLDEERTLRFRLGQQKIPYGWENLQSSQNRAPLDRSDAINSGAPSERDLGLMLYWEPARIRKLFKYLVDSGLKGSGDYGVVGFGAYNGQTLNTDDLNGQPHLVARVSYPLTLGTQILELGVAGYIGKFEVAAETGSAGNFRDMRVEAQVILYPQPIGFQAEYNIGKGPELDLATNTVEVKNLHGGYAMLIARVGDVFPYLRVSSYNGGLKHFELAPHSVVKELVVGAEWQIKEVLELTAEVDVASRELDGVKETGTLVRLQAQINY
ncbi:MAG: porin [Kofleriaceae bacterium]|nr:porin [Kofleriaceae bacterium]